MCSLQQNSILMPGTNNQTVKHFRHLCTSRTFRRKQRAFAMEGLRLVRDAMLSHVHIQALLLTQTAAEQHGGALTALQPDVRTLLVSDALAREIADTETAQGIFAVADMLLETDALPAAGQQVMVLHQVQDPANLGAVLRTAEALGTDCVCLYQCCDLYNPKTLRSSMGALFRVPVCRISDMDAFFSHCEAAGLPTCAAVVDRDAEQLGSVSFAGGAAVLIGNEGNGLPQSISDACTRRITIPMAPASNSLNAAAAAGLFLWEMRRTGILPK